MKKQRQGTKRTNIIHDENIIEGNYKLFGILNIRALQFLNSPKGYLLFHCLFAIFANSLSSGVVSINVTSIEKRFGLTSSDSALVVVGYDIAFCVLTVFITYFGGNCNRARLVAIGGATFGLGALIYSMPHFLTGPYQFGENTLKGVTCNANSTLDCSSPPKDLHYNMYILMLGQILLGAGVTPLYTLGIAYIENSVSKRSSAIYFGLANGASILGPIIGFTLGGVFLSKYFVDFNITTETYGLSPYDPRWVGAWWLYPLIVMGVVWLIFIPISGFPKYLPGTLKSRRTRVSEVHESNAAVEFKGFKTSLKNLPRAIFSLLRNPTYSLITLAACTQGLMLSGYVTFLPKFYENAFHLTAGYASLLTGVVVIPAGILGNVLGGLVVYKFKWTIPGILKFCVSAWIIVAVLSPCFLLHCDNIEVAGITIPYGNITINSETATPPANLESSCNSNCSCQEEFYTPVCGYDNTTYFSPCHAGCNVEVQKDVYANCSCVDGNFPNDTYFDKNYSAIKGICSSSCKNLNIFLGVVFCLAVCGLLSFTPLTVASFRAIPVVLKSLGVGVQLLFIRLFGTIPGPNIYGSLIDSACLLWKKEQCTGDRGSCWIYSNRQMGKMFMLAAVVGNLMSAAFLIVALRFHKPVVVSDEATTVKHANPQMKEQN